MHSLLHLQFRAALKLLTAKKLLLGGRQKFTENSDISKTTRKVNDDGGADRTTKSCLAGLGAVLPRSRVWNQSMDPSHVFVYGREREGAESTQYVQLLSLKIT